MLIRSVATKIISTCIIFFSAINFAAADIKTPQAKQNSPIANYPQQLRDKLTRFAEADVTRLDEYLVKFTDDELLQIWQDYSQSKPLNEKRFYHIIKAYEERIADAKAETKLKFLFLALIFLFLLIFILALITYRQQRKIAQILGKDST